MLVTGREAPSIAQFVAARIYETARDQ